MKLCVVLHNIFELIKTESPAKKAKNTTFIMHNFV